MTSCLRVLGAFSYRQSRRHSTIILITGFIVSLLFILHIYASRHNSKNTNPMQAGDFEYRPGLFLAGKYPLENISYCEFNYGLPDKINWGTFPVYSSPEEGDKGPYRVIYDAVKGTAYSDNKYGAVTYATQATPEFLYHIVEIARYWDGPISLAVFVPDYDFDIAMQILVQLCHCYPGMAKVSVHLFYLKKLIPKIVNKVPMATIVKTTLPSTLALNEMHRIKLENYRNLTNKTRAEYVMTARKKKIANMMLKMEKEYVPFLTFEDCSSTKTDIQTFRQQHMMVYPINVGRNIARNASRTNYYIVSDIEMVPSDGLAPKFLAMLRKLMGDKKRDEGRVFGKTVFVVPLFEVDWGEHIPRDKLTLVQLVQENRAMYFHQKQCVHCQRFPGLQTWLKRTPSKGIEPMLIARREYPYHRWEPLYFGTHAEPWYSEMLSWEGRQDKMTQMLEMCLQQYRLVVLDGGFMCHAAVNKPSDKHYRAVRTNLRRYSRIVRVLKQRYRDRSQCKVDWGCRESG